MSRNNEYRVKGGAFLDPEDAINALDSLLQDVDATDEKSANTTEIERHYHNNIVGLQECLDQVFSELRATWLDLGLEGSFALVRENVDSAAYRRQTVFQHPVYEHLWLTNSDGEDIGENVLPFMFVDLEYNKENNSVLLTHTKVDTKLNLPELQTSLKSAREDLQLVKAEVERAGTVLTTAIDTVMSATSAVREYCSANQLEFESTEGVSSPAVATKKNKEAVEATSDQPGSSDAEVVVDEELSITDDIEEDDDLISELEQSLDDDEDEIEEDVVQAGASRASSPPPLRNKKY